jgi:intein-encoded DNA endonuclease-like protein
VQSWPPIRSRPYQGIDLEGQIAIYDRAMELRALGYTYQSTVTKVRDEFDARITKRTLITWTKEGRRPLGRAHTFVPTPTPELAYIIGVEKGDGSLNVRQDVYSYRIRLQSIDLDFVEEFNRCLSKVLNTPKHATWRGAGRRETHVEASSFLLYRFLQKQFKELQPFIEHCFECSAAFLRGFFDSEGSVGKDGSLTAWNSDKSLLIYVQDLLVGSLGIETTGPHLGTRKGSKLTRRGRTYVRNSDCFGIRVRNRFRRLFLQKVGITIERKKLRLREVLDIE